jgi:hypothetical protein
MQLALAVPVSEILYHWHSSGTPWLGLRLAPPSWRDILELQQLVQSRRLPEVARKAETLKPTQASTVVTSARIMTSTGSA